MLRIKKIVLLAVLAMVAALFAGCPSAPQETSTMDDARTPLTQEMASEAAGAAAAETAMVAAPAPAAPVPAASATAAAAPAAPATATTPANAGTAATATATPARLPRLVDVGSNSCIPCRMMAPILEQLKAEYAGRAEIIVIDLNEDRAAGQRYAIRAIPTQIFYDANGNEVSRHEGFLPKEEIVKIFQQMGVR